MGDDELGEVEQLIANTEMAITIQQRWIHQMIRRGEGVYLPTTLLKDARARLASLHLWRRQLLRARFDEPVSLASLD
ncbi:MAG: hypothetical protein JO141_05410 [Bradyrhizobium sp.]|nr:hypothetical protein [Bradyrhizobium sp.]